MRPWPVGLRPQGKRRTQGLGGAKAARWRRLTYGTGAAPPVRSVAAGCIPAASGSAESTGQKEADSGGSCWQDSGRRLPKGGRGSGLVRPVAVEIAVDADRLAGGGGAAFAVEEELQQLDGLFKGARR